VDRRTTCSARRGSGFTLLEVVAAVLIFAVTFTALAGHSMSWVRSQGVSDRRIRAGLIADRELLQMETQLELGQMPPVDEEEKDEEEFQVTVSVEPWVPPFDLAAAQTPGSPGQPTPSRPSDSVPSLLTPTRENPEGPLRRIRVRVAWDEGIDTLEVSRTTFALDRDAANAVLESLGLGEAPDGGVPQ
jgi:prepilin-type N-terminal cleavage/methylation domain-containing protein